MFHSIGKNVEEKSAPLPIQREQVITKRPEDDVQLPARRKMKRNARFALELPQRANDALGVILVAVQLLD